MRVVHISDTHGKKYHNKLEIPECDILIHSGDIGGRTSPWELLEFLEWFEKQDAGTKIFVPGNHDITLDREFWFNKLKNGEEVIAEMLKQAYLKNIEMMSKFDVKVLIDEEVIVDGLKIYGSPYSPSFHRDHWAFNADRGKEIQEKWKMIPRDTDILITHGPLYGILDDVKEYARPNEDPHVGCKDLLKRIEDLPQLKLFCCGHIHDNYAVQQVNIGGRDILVSNAAMITNNYKIIYTKPNIINI